MKICNDCKLEKLADAFWNNKHSRDGKDGLCIECRKSRSKRYNERNKDKIKQYNRQYRRNRLPVRAPEKYKPDIEYTTQYDLDEYKVEEGFIYLIQEKTFTKNIKIGKTVNIHNRTRQLSGSLPFDIEFVTLFYVKTRDMHRLERLIQMKFESKRTRGEWFDLTDVELKDAIEFLKENCFDEQAIYIGT